LQNPESVQTAYQMLIAVAEILIAGSLAAIVARKLRVPDIVLYLLVGMAIGPFAFDLIGIPLDSAVNQFILIFGASYILFDGGALLDLRVLRKVWPTLLILATVGVLVTAAITGWAAMWMFGIALPVALLLGTTIAPTDPATLVPVFKQVTVRPKVAQTVMSESAFNDATGAIMAFALLGIAMGTQQFSLGDSLTGLVREAGLGVLIGGAVGWTATALVSDKGFGLLRGNIPIMTLILVPVAYMLAVAFHGSGFMSVFIAGVVLGNNELFGFGKDAVDEHALHEYVETTGLMFRIFIFVLLGVHVDFNVLGQYWKPALGVVLVFIFIARPITVFVCCAFDRGAEWTFKEKVFMSWMRMTGVIPGALAGLLAGWGAPNADVISAVTFVAILVTISVQATTTRLLAEKLDLLER
jgi:cell volume regulation protein A